jgi:hypothetical protein
MDQGLGLPELLEDGLHDVDVGLLVMAPDVIDLAIDAMTDNQIDRIAMVSNIKPVPDVHALAIDRQRLIVDRFLDHERNQLLRVLVRPVVIGAAGHRDRELEGPVIR